MKKIDKKLLQEIRERLEDVFILTSKSSVEKIERQLSEHAQFFTKLLTGEHPDFDNFDDDILDDMIYDASNLDDYPDGYAEYGTSLEAQTAALRKSYEYFLKKYFS